MATNARPRQILTSLFALDESYQKRVDVGLEYDHLVNRESYKPVARISSPNFNGIPFDYRSWMEFEEAFSKFDKFFSGGTIGKIIERVRGTGWVAVLRRRSRIITLSDTKVRSIVTLTKMDFKWLVNAAKFIEDKLKYLETVSKCVSDTVWEYYSTIKNDCKMNHDAQITYYTRSLIDEVNDRVKDTIVNQIVNKIGLKDVDKNVGFNANDIEIVLHELIAYHMDEIITDLNYEIMYMDYLEIENKTIKKQKKEILM